MQICGVVKDIVYRNLENAYTVLKIESENRIVVATGKFPIVGEGEIVKLEGEFKINPKFGEQFFATSINVSKPTTDEQIEKYLSSGLISGVGVVTAHSIVKEFGADTFDVIENSPTKLSSVRGISLKKALEIHRTFSDIQKMQNSVIFLQNYDISINLAVKIYTKYKSRTEDIISTNPYKLVEDIDGIGFKTADKIAMKIGIDKDSPFRIRAGLLYVLGEVSNKLGSTIAKKDIVFFETLKLLELPVDVLNDLLEQEEQKLALDMLIKDIVIDGEQYIAIASYYKYEKSIATNLLSLKNSGDKFEKDVASEIEHYEKKNKITLSDGQRTAVQISVNNPVVVLTGGPGTGKTTIVKCVLEILKAMNKKCVLMAPTGRAAKRMEEATNYPASTIHRALEFSFQDSSAEFEYNSENPIEADVVIVDEASMLDCFVAYSLTQALAMGTKLILVGDKDQLPSVGAGNVLADIIESQKFPVVELTQIYRQDSDSRIVVNAHKVNNSEMPDLNEKSKDFFFIQSDNAEESCDTILGLIKTRLPKFLNVSSDKIQIIAPMKAGFCGVDNLNVKIQNELNPEMVGKAQIEFTKRVFRVGDRVMQTTNNYEQEWSRENARGYTDFGKGVFNGDMGVITDITEQTKEVVVMFEDGRECSYSMAELDELVLSYAITVHKSQGSEFDAVVIPVFGGNPMLYNKNLLYTALTRAKKLVVIIGNPKSLYSMVKNKMVNKRETMLKRLLNQFEI